MMMVKKTKIVMMMAAKRKSRVPVFQLVSQSETDTALQYKGCLTMVSGGQPLSFNLKAEHRRSKEQTT